MAMSKENTDLDAMWKRFQSLMDEITHGVCDMFGGGKRDKIANINKISDVIQLIHKCGNTIKCWNSRFSK